ncbi:hypothetical protein [Paraconexibacter sp.]|uniref:hypothetical protein n=1 Tax=Paraconexibacter sp. TaxID=2949640 RepID=UPI003566B0FE
MAVEDDIDTRDAEIAALRARVSELETQLSDQARATNELVARSQQKLYWLERWDVDLDRVMEKPGALRALETLKAFRGVVRSVRRTSRRLRGVR